MSRKIDRSPITRRRAGRMHAGGFSLIEALLALVILTVGVLTVVQGYSVCLRGQRDAEEFSVATLLAEKQLDEIRVGPIPEGPTQEGTFEDMLAEWAFAEPDLLRMRPRWEAEYTLSEVDGLVKIDLTILWTRGEIEKQYTWTTLHYWPPNRAASISGGSA